MNFKKSYQIFICIILSTLISHGISAQLQIIKQPITIAASKTSMKQLLNNLSKQSGCVFSYDPSKINDKQILSIKSYTNQKLILILQNELPSYIQLKVHGKYIVLQKKSELDLKLKAYNSPTLLSKQSSTLAEYDFVSKSSDTLPDSTSFSTIPVKPIMALTSDTSIQNQAKSELPLELKLITDSITTKTNQDTLQKRKADTTILVTSQTKTEIISKKLENPFYKKFNFQIDVVSFNSMGGLSISLGVKRLYGIVTASGISNQYNCIGLGVGTNIPLNQKFGIGLIAMRHKLNGGRSFDLGIRGTIGQFATNVSYSFNNTFSLYGGPSLILLKTNYYRKSITPNGKDTYFELSRKLELGIILGVKVDISSLFYPKRSK